METIFVKKETDLGSYYQYPKWLDSIDLSWTAKYMYVLLLDRTRVSATNDKYMDSKKNFFVLFTYSKLCQALNRKETVIKKALAELESIDLIVRERQGIGLPNKIYVKVPVVERETTNKVVKRPSSGREINHQKGEEETANNMRSSNIKPTNSRRMNRFVNYPQSEWNFEEIEAMERQLVMRDIAADKEE